MTNASSNAVPLPVPETAPVRLQVAALRTRLLGPVSFSLSAGECITVRGPSGSGKTLLLRAITDLDPSESLVLLDGRERATMTGPAWRRRVGYMPAEPGWWADTVGEHFPNWPEARSLAGELGLEDAGNWPIVRLSTGERLRLALIRALMMQPLVLLLDEPTAALDPASVGAVEALILGRVRAGLAVVWVTHDAAQARRVATRCLVVSDGQVSEEVARCRATSP